jgi:hypothetical protein
LRCSGPVGGHLGRARFGAPLAFGAHRSGRDDGWRDASAPCPPQGLSCPTPCSRAPCGRGCASGPRSGARRG